MERPALLALLGVIAAGEAIPASVLEKVFASLHYVLATPVDLAEWNSVVHEYVHVISTQPVGSLIRDLTADVLPSATIWSGPIRHLSNPGCCA